MRIASLLLPVVLAFSVSSFVNAAEKAVALKPAVAAKPVATSKQAAPQAAAAASSSRVNVNTADAATLARLLNGVGEKKAEAIISYRKTNGPFSSLAQLEQVDGIGPATIEKNKHLIVFR